MALRTPKYRLHRGSGQAVVQIDGRRLYLGKHGSEESKERYRRILGKHLTSGGGGGSAADDAFGEAGLTINELIVAYWAFVETYYVKNGAPTDEQPGIRLALRALQRLYGRSETERFGPSALKVVRQTMIDAGHSRTYINKNINRIRRMIRWATSEEFLPSGIYHSLQSVEGLKAGRTEAPEPQPIRPVPDEAIAAVLPYLSRQVAAMVELQRMTGARPGEIVLIRPRDVRQLSEQVWRYTPASHKTAHHHRERLIHLGPRGQAILQPWLTRETNAYCFSPKEVVCERNEARRAARKTPMTPTQAKRRPKQNPKRAPGEHYTTQSYGKAVSKACRKAGVPTWSPNQLRHNAATFLRKEYGIEAARVILGHASASVTEVYAELDHAKAAQIMAQVG